MLLSQLLVIKARPGGASDLLSMDALGWWRSIGREQVPLLACAKCRFLAPRATSVASESLFSLTGRIATKSRS